jgi:hypothetical protein
MRSNGKSLQPIKIEESWTKKLVEGVSTSFHSCRAAVFALKGWLGGGREFAGKEWRLWKARGWDG